MAEHSMHTWTDVHGVSWACDAYDHGPFCRLCRIVEGAEIVAEATRSLARTAELVEVFRKALMEAHADDWDMETVSEAAHICARALVASEQQS